MANPEHLAILKQGVEEWNEWRKGQSLKSQSDLSGANLSGADLRGVNFSVANLREVDLRGANLTGAEIWGARLDKASLAGADLSHMDLDRISAEDADLAAANLRSVYLSQARLDRANLRGANFLFARIVFDTKFREANLSGADFGSACVSSGNFENALLADVNFRHAVLSGGKFRSAKLARANLEYAHIEDADLWDSDLTEARAGGTTFADVDLSVAKGLETVRHSGPSTVGIDTIYKSRGKIPEVFLRGCGVPDEFIAYIGSMVGRPIEFYSCFISYSTKDQEFADRLYADLQAKGVRCWFAPHDIQGGKTIHEQIDEAIRRYDRLLLILSEHSIHSGWVETEIANAWERQMQQGKHVLFPVRLVSFEELEKWKCPDPKTGKDLGREIRKYFIPDFSNWKEDDPYQEVFQRLVKDLKAGDS